MGRCMRERLLREGPLWRKRLLLGLVVLVPLLVLRDLNDPINVPKLACLLVGVSVVATIRAWELLQGATSEGLKRLLIPAAALALPLVLGWLFSPYKGWSLFGIYPRYLGLVPYLVVIAFGVLLVDAFEGDVRPIAWAVTAAGALAGGYSVIQWIGLDPFDWSVGGETAPDRYVVSTFGNPNFAGAWLATALPVAAGLFLVEPDRRIWLGVALAFTSAGWVAAGSEVAWIAGLAGLLVLGGWVASPRWRWARVAAAIGSGLMAAAVVGAVIATIAGVDADRLVTAQRRGDWWQAAIGMAADSPVVGRGPNAFALEHPSYRTQQDAQLVGLGITDDPHSVPLSLLTGAGITGLAGFLILIGWTVRRGFSAAPGPSLAAAFLASATVYFVQSLASIDTVSLRTALWVALAGLAASKVSLVADKQRKAKRASSRKLSPVQHPAGVIVALVLGLCSVAFAATLLLNDAQFAHANDLFRGGDLNASQTEFEASSTGRSEIAYRRAYGNLLGDVAVALENEGKPFIEQSKREFSFVNEVPQVNSLVDYARTLRDWVPHDPTAADDAGDLYLRAARLDPRDPVLLVEAVPFFLEHEDFAAIAIALRPHVREIGRSDLWGALALAEAQLGNVARARRAMEAALQLDPVEPNAVAAGLVLERQK